LKRHASFERQHVKAFPEVAQNGIDKATSTKNSREKLGIHQRKSLLGNAGNDLAMIEYAGLGVWVDNVDPN
jgi:hydroxymethylpyrimidine pyrophosphatase-like HAD family hydrolase